MTYLLGGEHKPSIDELVHYGVKGMRWGVTRSDEELSRSRVKQQSKADKQAEKSAAKTEKWAAKQAEKGKAQKKLEKLEKTTRRTAAQEAWAREGAELRRKKFDQLVEKEMAKDPNFSKTMTKNERAYLERQAANTALTKAYVSKQAKQRGSAIVVNNILKTQVDLDSMDKSQRFMLQAGVSFATGMFTSKITKAESKTIRDLSALQAVEKRQAQAQALRDELKKRGG